MTEPLSPQEAKVLAFIERRYKAGLPFPPRRKVAELLDISVPALDNIITEHIVSGLLTVEYRDVTHNAAGRPSTLKERYLIPAWEAADD